MASTSKNLQSRIWTSSTDMEIQHINFSDSDFVSGNNLEINDFDKKFLGVKDVSSPTSKVNPEKYISFVSKMVHEVDDKALVYGIVHDSDIVSDESGNAVYKNGAIVYDSKSSHLHILIRYSSPKRITTVSHHTGIEPNFLMKSKVRGKYAFSSAMAYLIHALSPQKHQYSPESVINGEYNSSEDIKNESTLYKDYALAHKSEWEARLATIKSKSVNTDFDKIYDDILFGKLTKNDLLSGSEELYRLYAKNKDKFDKARDTYLERQFLLYSSGIQSGDIKLRTLFITGNAGAGKTHLAFDIAKEMSKSSEKSSKGVKWRTFVAAATNGFDDYDGEEIVLLDDLRANSMTASDWLRLLDPKTSGKISARYHNSSLMPHLLIITATDTPHEFFSYVKGLGGQEPIDQFLRRVQDSVNIVDLNHVDLGHIKKLDAPQTAKISQDEIVSKVENSYGSSFYKRPGKSRFYSEAYSAEWSGTREEILHKILFDYCIYFNFDLYTSDLGSVKNLRKVQNSYLPITKNDDIIL